MSEVSLEAQSGKTSADDPQVDCENADKAEESFSEDVKLKSADNDRGRVVSDEVMYDIDINSTEENSENCDRDVQKEYEGAQSERVVTCSDGDPARGSGSIGNGIQEASEESGDTRTEAKVMFTVILVNQPLLALAYCAPVCVDSLWWWSHEPE